MAEASELVIGIDLPEGDNIFRPTSTRFAYLAVVDVIASLVAYRNRKQSQVTLRHIKQQLVEHRDGGTTGNFSETNPMLASLSEIRRDA